MHKQLLMAAAFVAAAPAFAQGRINFFENISRVGITGGIAEIVDASGDGNTLAFSDADAGRVGFIDITDPVNPVVVSEVVTGGEPTAVSFEGDICVAAVIRTLPEEGQPAPDPSDPANAGTLFVIDASTPAAPVVLGRIAIGFQPDSVKLTTVRNRLVAVVCIENEPIVVDASELVLDEDIPGFPTSGADFPQDRSLPGLVQVVTINRANIALSNVANVLLPARRLNNAGLLFPTDPQPEFVDINGTRAVISMQENNGFVLLSIADPLRPRIRNIFSAGNAAERNSDLVEDDAISLSQGYPSSIGTTVDAPEDGAGNPILGGPRQPDAVAFSPDGTRIYSADEGELNFTGGRGWSGHDLAGNEIYADAGALEQIAVFLGQFPEGRSENRGIEIEGIETASFGRGNDFAFVLSERGSFMAVYDINGRSPRFVQFLPTGISPEGVVAIPSRGLVVTSEEESGTLSIYQGRNTLPTDADAPTLLSFDTPFGAISGTDNAFNIGAWTIPDNALPTTISFVPLGGPFAFVLPLLPVTVNGVQARYDGEGIVRDDSILAPFGGFLGGFFFASEGNGRSRPNLIVQTDLLGRVQREIQLPASIDAAADASVGGNAVGSIGGGTIRSNGFEGVTLSNDGRYLFACVQRQFNGEAATHTRIARYDLRQIDNGTAPNNGLRFGGDWEFFYYPLEAAGDAGFIGLSEITALPNGDFLVIERDQGIGAEAVLKAVYRFSLNGLVADTDGQPGEVAGNDTVSKTLAVDVLDDFFPFEKVEGLAIVNGNLWVSLDNDGGEVENVFVNKGGLR